MTTRWTSVLGSPLHLCFTVFFQKETSHYSDCWCYCPVLPVWGFYVNGTKHCWFLCVWFLSLNVLVRFICDAVCGSSPFIFYCRVSIIWANHKLFTHFIVDGHLGYIQLLVIMTNTAANVLVNICWARIWGCIYLEGDCCVVGFAYFNLVSIPKPFSKWSNRPLLSPSGYESSCGSTFS